MKRLFCGMAALLLTAALGPAAYAGVPGPTYESYGVKIAGMKPDEESRSLGLPEKVEDCFTFFDDGVFSSNLGSGEWESKEVVFLELITVTIEGYEDEGDVTLNLVRIGDKLVGIGRYSNYKLKTYLISGKADDCGDN